MTVKQQISISEQIPVTNPRETEELQRPLDIAILDLAAALPIATSTPMMNHCQYRNSNLVYNE